MSFQPHHIATVRGLGNALSKGEKYEPSYLTLPTATQWIKPPDPHVGPVEQRSTNENPREVSSADKKSTDSSSAANQHRESGW